MRFTGRFTFTTELRSGTSGPTKETHFENRGPYLSVWLIATLAHSPFLIHVQTIISCKKSSSLRSPLSLPPTPSSHSPKLSLRTGEYGTTLLYYSDFSPILSKYFDFSGIIESVIGFMSVKEGLSVLIIAGF